ncbi:MAG: hypothetical protein ABW167_19340, partial [Baekduia sp.]
MRPTPRRLLAEPNKKARQATPKTATRIPTPIGRVSATPAPTLFSLASLNFGVRAGLGVDLRASSASALVVTPEDAAPG